MRALPATLPAFLRTANAHDAVRASRSRAGSHQGLGRAARRRRESGTLPRRARRRNDRGRRPARRAAARRARLRARARNRAASHRHVDAGISAVLDRRRLGAASCGTSRIGAPTRRRHEPRRAPAIARSSPPTARSARSLTMRDIGYWGHFVADASQPLHVTVHYNGWNDEKTHTAYPNPNAFSDSTTVHARFETTLVRAVATEDLGRRAYPGGAALHGADPHAGRRLSRNDRKLRSGGLSARGGRRDRRAQPGGDVARLGPARGRRGGVARSRRRGLAGQRRCEGRLPRDPRPRHRVGRGHRHAREAGTRRLIPRSPARRASKFSEPRRWEKPSAP